MRGMRAPAAALLGVVVAAVTALPATAYSTAYGHTTSADRRLRHGCHSYRYHYLVKPGTGDWLFETQLYDPDGQQLGTGDFAPGSDPTEGPGYFRVCSETTHPGRFTIRARLDWYTPPSTPLGQPTEQSVWFKPTHLRLTRR